MIEQVEAMRRLSMDKDGKANWIPPRIGRQSRHDKLLGGSRISGSEYSMAGNANLVISITAKGRDIFHLQKVKMNLGDLEKSSGDLGESVGGLGDIFGSTLGKIGAGIGAAFAVEKMASAAFELGKVGAAAERTQASFATMAAGVGSSGDEMLAAMQQATAGRSATAS